MKYNFVKITCGRAYYYHIYLYIFATASHEKGATLWPYLAEWSVNRRAGERCKQSLSRIFKLVFVKNFCRHTCSYNWFLSLIEVASWIWKPRQLRREYASRFLITISKFLPQFSVIFHHNLECIKNYKRFQRVYSSKS